MNKVKLLSIEELNLMVHIMKISHNGPLATAVIIDNLKKRDFARYEKTIDIIDTILGAGLKYSLGGVKLSKADCPLFFKPIDRKTIRSIIATFFQNDYSIDIWTNMIISNVLCIENDSMEHYIFKDMAKITLQQIRYLISNDLFNKFKLMMASGVAMSINEILLSMVSNLDHKHLNTGIDNSYAKLVNTSVSTSTRHTNQTLKMGELKHSRPSSKLPTPPPIPEVSKPVKHTPAQIHLQEKPEPEAQNTTIRYTDDKFMICGIQIPYSVELLDAMPCNIKKTLCDFKGFTSYRGLDDAKKSFADRRVLEYKRAYGLLLRARFLDACMARVYINTPMLTISMRLWETKEGYVTFNGKEYCVADETNPLFEKDDISLAINYSEFTSEEIPKDQIKIEEKVELKTTNEIGSLKSGYDPGLFQNKPPVVKQETNNQSFKMKILKQLSEINRLFDKVELLQAANLFIINMPDGGYKNNLHNISAVNQITFNQTTSVIATLKTNGFIKIIYNKIVLNTKYFSDLTFDFEEEFCDGEERYTRHTIDDQTM